MSTILTNLGHISFKGKDWEQAFPITVQTPFEIHHTGKEKLRDFIKKKFDGIAVSNSISSEDLGRVFKGEPTSTVLSEKVQEFWGSFAKEACKYDARKFLAEEDTAALPEAPFSRPGIGRAVYDQVEPSPKDPIARMKSASPFVQEKGENLPTRRQLARQIVEAEARRQGFLRPDESYDQVWDEGKKALNPFCKAAKRYKTLKESETGTYQSMWTRRHYAQDLLLEKPMTDYGLEKEFNTIDRFAHLSTKNGLQFIEHGKVYTVEAALVSSFDRFATSPSMARKVEDARNGSSILYGGRPGIAKIEEKEQTIAMAKDEARVVFFGEIDTFEKHPLLAKGLSTVEVGLPNGRVRVIHELQLVDQSLLSMSGQEKKNYEKMVLAFATLSAQTNNELLEFVHPVTGKTYFVRIKPVPAAANQFNVFTTIEKLTADDWSGRTATLEASNVADLSLRQIAIQTLQAKFSKYSQEIFTFDPKPPLSPLQKLVQDLLPKCGNDRNKIENEIFKIINDTFKGIMSRTLEPWQEVLGRQLVCHLAGLPLITHCQSSVDRTGIAIALASALQHWLKGKQPTIIPQKIDETYAIWDVVNCEGTYQKNGETVKFHPFRELVLFNCVKGNKCAEHSRVDPGYKWTAHSLIADFGLHPALKSILPVDIMHVSIARKYITSNLKFAAVVVMLILSLLLFVLFGWSAKLTKKDVPYFKTISNLAITNVKTIKDRGRVFRQPVFHTESLPTKKLRDWGILKPDPVKRRKLVRGMGAVDLHEGA